MNDQKVSRGLSLARGFTVLIMPAVHTVLLYSQSHVKTGLAGQILGFLAEGPGAPLFMFLMAVFIVLGRPKTFQQILYRSLLMIIGYLVILIEPAQGQPRVAYFYEL